MPVFDPEGEGYDYETALRYGMGPDGTGENLGHWGSRVELNDQDRPAGYPVGTGLMLKGAKHMSWDKALLGEKQAGYNVLKIGNRYYSVPKQFRGLRPDGTPKGSGWLGELPRPVSMDPGKTRPGVSTELSVGVDFGNGEQLIPTLVPTLSHPEVQWLLNNQGLPPDPIMQKAVDFARQRMRQGLSPFKD